MVVVTLSEKEKIIFDVFSWLRKQLPDVDISTLRHISVYLAMTNDQVNIDKDLKLIMSTDKTMCNLVLSDGTEIRFANSSHKLLNFVVEKQDLDICMTLLVSMQEINDSSIVMLCGDVVCGDWNYVVGIEDYENKLCFIKTYYKDKLIENGISYFKASVNGETGLDCIDGLGYLTDVMVKLRLLYNNVRNINKNKLVRRKLA